MVLTQRVLGVFVLLVLTGSSAPVSPQRGLGAGGGFGLIGFGPRLGVNVELAIELQGRLNLSEEQVTALRELDVISIEGIRD